MPCSAKARTRAREERGQSPPEARRGGGRAWPGAAGRTDSCPLERIGSLYILFTVVLERRFVLGFRW